MDYFLRGLKKVWPYLLLLVIGFLVLQAFDQYRMGSFRSPYYRGFGNFPISLLLTVLALFVYSTCALCCSTGFLGKKIGKIYAWVGMVLSAIVLLTAISLAWDLSYRLERSLPGFIALNVGLFGVSYSCLLLRFRPKDSWIQILIYTLVGIVTLVVVITAVFLLLNEEELLYLF